MDVFSNLMTGFAAAGTFQNIGFALIGCLLGTLIGVLPGIGPIPTIAILLPITYGLDPLSSLVMLAGIYYGAAYGGSTTSILVNMPGEASSIVTCIDGHQMAKQGRAGAAEVRMHTVAEGDSLSRISMRYYGTANRWQEIFQANRDVLQGSSTLRIGMQLRIP